MMKSSISKKSICKSPIRPSKFKEFDVIKSKTERAKYAMNPNLLQQKFKDLLNDLKTDKIYSLLEQGS